MPDFASTLNICANGQTVTSIVQSPAAGIALSQGTTAASLSVTFDDGTVEDCNFNVEVNIINSSLPAALCSNFTVALDASGIALLNPSDIDAGSSGVCGLQFGLSQTTFNCNDIGDHLVTLTVQDGNGQQSSCSSTVTVIDNTAPDCSVQDITLALDQFGDAVINPEDINLNSSDACGLQLLSVDPCSSCNFKYA